MCYNHRDRRRRPLTKETEGLCLRRANSYLYLNSIVCRNGMTRVMPTSTTWQLRTGRSSLYTFAPACTTIYSYEKASVENGKKTKQNQKKQLQGLLGPSIGKVPAFGSSHDLGFVGSSPESGSPRNREYACPSPSPALCSCSLSLSK